MKTKQEILSEVSHSRGYLYAGHVHSLKDWHAIYDQVIDDYAREVAVGFADWKEANGWMQSPTKGVWYQGVFFETTLTTEQLFDKYLQEKDKV